MYFEHIKSEIIKTIFPIKCSNCGLISERYLCDYCLGLLEEFNPECFVCRKKSSNWNIHSHCKKETVLNKGFYFYKYDNVIHNLVLSIKYSFHKDKINELVNLIVESKEFNDILKLKFDLITFIPMSKQRENWRGFNQTELMSKNFSQRLDIPNFQLLQKLKNTTPQIDLTREERLKNLKSVFKLKEELPLKLNNQNILLIDDICTTGSTLNECGRAIKANFPRLNITAMCLARGEN